ncbi:hypothetical protein MRX96_041044 [Rhipicephalus microplus]
MTLCRSLGRVLLLPSRGRLGDVSFGSRRTMSDSGNYSYETLLVSKPSEHVFQVEMNRPDKLNAMNAAFWAELPACFQQLQNDRECRVVVVSGSGRIFTAGLDLASMAGSLGTQSSGDEEPDVARKARHLHRPDHQVSGDLHVYRKVYEARDCSRP